MEYWNIAIKYIRNEASEEEIKTLEDWLKEDAANAQLFEEAKHSWSSFDRLNSRDINFDTAKAWDSVQQKIKQESKQIQSNNNNNNFIWVFRAAAILILSLFSTWFLMNRTGGTEELMVQTYAEKKMVTLPDSSKVWLNINSKLIYPKQFDAGKRIVKLEGEAFFDVTKNPKQPFVIQNKDFEIKVLGTSFNLLAYAHLKEVMLTVVSGTVAFTSNFGETILLTENETGLLDKSSPKLCESDRSNPNAIAWKTHKIEFSNDPVKTVCNTLKDYFSIEIVAEDNAIYNCKFTGSFVEPKLQDVLRVMENTLNVKIKTNQKRVTISGKGC